MDLSRQELHRKLSGIPGVSKVYFQPPNGTMLTYPCIIYKRRVPDMTHADNLPYHQTKAYQVMVIDPDPDSQIVEALTQWPMCSMETPFVNDNLYHTPFQLYYDEGGSST